MKQLDDQELIENYLNGNEKSFELLVKKYLKPIYSFVYRYLNNQQDAEDITQETFIKIWKNIKKFDKNKSFKTWLFTIAKNSALDALKSKKTIPFATFNVKKNENILDKMLLNPDFMPDKIIEKKDFVEQLILTIKKLPLKYREILFLYYKEGFNFQEIADILSESVNTVKSRHRRAIVFLKKLFPSI